MTAVTYISANSVPERKLVSNSASLAHLADYFNIFLHLRHFVSMIFLCCQSNFFISCATDIFASLSVVTMWQIFCKEIGKRIFKPSDGLNLARSITILEVG